MRFGELVRDPRFGFSVIVGGADTLDLPIRRGYITDLPDPSRFLSDGTVVLSSGLWVDRPDGVARFTGALRRAGARILVLGLIELGHVPDAVIDACRRDGLVLATLSEDASFGSVIDAIREGTDSLTSVGGLQDAVATAIAAGGLTGALDAVSTDLGAPCWVAGSWGTVFTASEIWPASRPVDCLVQGLADASTVELRDLGVSPPAAVIRLDLGFAGYDAILVVDSDLRGLDDATRRRIMAAAAALRPELHVVAQDRIIEHDRTAALLHAATDESVPPGEISALMRIAGLDPQEPLRVVTAEVSDVRMPPHVVGALLEGLIADSGARLARGALGSRALIIQNGPLEDDAAFHERLLTAVPALEERLGDRRMLVAASDSSTRISQIGHTVSTALDRLTDLDGDVQVTVADASASTSYRALLRDVGERTRQTFASAVLEPLVEYDAKHGADLVETVRVFLDHGGAWQEAAAALHVHPNTLRYRIARVEELTRRDMGSMRDRVDVFLALAARDI